MAALRLTTHDSWSGFFATSLPCDFHSRLTPVYPGALNTCPVIPLSTRNLSILLAVLVFRTSNMNCSDIRNLLAAVRSCYRSAQLIITSTWHLHFSFYL